MYNMTIKKQIIITFGFFLIAGAVSAQWSYKWLDHYEVKHLLYTQGDMMVGSNSGGDLGFNFVYNGKYSVQVGFSATSNAFGISVKGALKSATSANPNELAPNMNMTENYHLMLGRHFNLISNGKIRFVLQGGPGMSVSMVAGQPEEANGKTSDVINIADKSTDLSVIVNSKFEFPITKTFGFSAGPTLIANHERSFVSFGVGFMYGILSTN